MCILGEYSSLYRRFLVGAKQLLLSRVGVGRHVCDG